MPNFHVKWEIDIEADTPEHAGVAAASARDQMGAAMTTHETTAEGKKKWTG